MRVWFGGLLAAGLGFGCGDGNKASIAPVADAVADVADDVAADVATDIPTDGSGPTDAAPGPADATQPALDVARDTTATTDAPVFSDVPVPAGGACPAVSDERGTVTFRAVPRTFPPPTFIGNIAGAMNPDGDWKLTELTFFQLGTFVDWVTVAFTNAGDTDGAATFGDDDMFAVEITLDMNIAVTVGENAGSDRATSTIGLGGPIVFDGGWLRGHLDRCGTGITAGRAFPEAVAYDHDGTKLRVAVVVSREDLIMLLPEDQRANAEYVVTGPLTVVARFER